MFDDEDDVDLRFWRFSLGDAPRLAMTATALAGAAAEGAWFSCVRSFITVLARLTASILFDGNIPSSLASDDGGQRVWHMRQRFSTAWFRKVHLSQFHCIGDTTVVLIKGWRRKI